MTMNKFHFNENKRDTWKCNWLISHKISIMSCPSNALIWCPRRLPTIDLHQMSISRICGTVEPSIDLERYEQRVKKWYDDFKSTLTIFGWFLRGHVVRSLPMSPLKYWSLVVYTWNYPFKAISSQKLFKRVLLLHSLSCLSSWGLLLGLNNFFNPISGDFPFLLFSFFLCEIILSLFALKWVRISCLNVDSFHGRTII